MEADEAYRLAFIDVDGVLNTRETEEGVIVPHFVSRFAKFVKDTRATPVLSTAWRLSPKSRELVTVAFLQHGLPLPLSCTPHFKKAPRGDEILTWLQHNTTNLFQRERLTAHPYDVEEGRFTEQNYTLPVRIRVSGFVVLDDKRMRTLKDGGTNRHLFTDSHFINTNPDLGFTEEDAVEARRLVMGPIVEDECHHCGLRIVKQLEYRETGRLYCNMKCQHLYFHNKQFI